MKPSSVESDIIDFIGGAISLVLIICAVLLLMKIFLPEIHQIKTSLGFKPYLQVAATVLLVVSFAGIVGVFNYAFLTCVQFENAGMKLPSNCQN